MPLKLLRVAVPGAVIALALVACHDPSSPPATTLDIWPYPLHLTVGDKVGFRGVATDAGTQRWDVAGLRVVVSDTAGLRLRGDTLVAYSVGSYLLQLSAQLDGRTVTGGRTVTVSARPVRLE